MLMRRVYTHRNIDTNVPYTGSTASHVNMAALGNNITSVLEICVNCIQIVEYIVSAKTVSEL